jgi:hypothetical protein
MVSSNVCLSEATVVGVLILISLPSVSSPKLFCCCFQQIYAAYSLSTAGSVLVLALSGLVESYCCSSWRNQISWIRLFHSIGYELSYTIITFAHSILSSVVTMQTRFVSVCQGRGSEGLTLSDEGSGAIVKGVHFLHALAVGVRAHVKLLGPLPEEHLRGRG